VALVRHRKLGLVWIFDQPNAVVSCAEWAKIGMLEMFMAFVFFSQGPNIDEIIPACSYIVGSMENKQ
jgi:hypothetical protein